MLIDSQPDMKVVFEASEEARLLAVVSDLALDVLLIDHRLSKNSGDKLVAQVNDLFFDAQDFPPRIIVTAPYFTAELDIAVIRAGASDFVAEESGSELLLAAIREVSAGAQESFYLALVSQFSGSEVKTVPNADFNFAVENLTSSQRGVLDAFVAGLTDSEMAVKLNIAPDAVVQIYEQIKIRFRFATRAQLALAIYESGSFTSGG